LAKMGEQYTVDGLDIRPLAKAQVSDPQLFDHWDHPIAGVTWTARHPGDAARQSYSFSALAAILALIGALLPISLVHARSIAELENKERTARQIARADSLSGLPNRMFLLEALGEALTEFHSKELALMFIDLDGFKAVNDAYDHETGDKLIRAVAAGLSALVAQQDVVARLGGDEFAVMVVGPDAATRSESLAEHVLEFVKEPFDISGRIANIGASIGIAERGTETLDPQELMRRADIAMYDAKNAGRNCWRHFDLSLDQKRLEDMEIASELRGFLQQGLLEVAYQPMVDSRTHNIIGVEALARWPSASSRNLPPNRFIAIAEEHGLIDDLGNLVLRIACRDVSQWQDLRLAVNLSPLQINSASLVPDIKRITVENGLSLSRLEIEFTETVLIRNPKRAKQVIHDLQSAGVTVALDDFGTGYASVGYLRDYAFDKIKLDRSLTQKVSRDVATQQVVQGTILIAKGLCADIIAEGVETAEQAQLMRLAGCGQLQGYYFGVPAKAACIAQAISPPSDDFQNERAQISVQSVFA
jgi:diguanylate cyclase (GGDEF)-like protein